MFGGKRLVIELDVSQDKAQLLFDITNFLLENQEEIRKNISSDVGKYLAKLDKAKPPFNLAFESNFPKFVREMVKKELMHVFNLNYEDAEVLFSDELLKLIDFNKLFSKRDLYSSKPRKKDNAKTNSRKRKNKIRQKRH